MAKYRKTALIEATQWHKSGDHTAVQSHPGDPSGIDQHTYPPLGIGHGWIPTLEGGHAVTPGDWIATGAHGEHWPIKDAVFRKTYELAE